MSDETAGDQKIGREPRASWTVRLLGRGLAGLLTLGALFEAGSVDEWFDYAPFPEARLLVYLGVSFATLFILKPGGRDQRRLRVPIYDGLIALVGTLFHQVYFLYSAGAYLWCLVSGPRALDQGRAEVMP